MDNNLRVHVGSSSAVAVAYTLGVSRNSLHRWKKELLGAECALNELLNKLTPAVGNIIVRDFRAAAPNKKWLTDLTEFHMAAGKVYLSPNIDCFDGMVISWTIGTSPDSELVNTMLDYAICNLPEGQFPIVHSDRECNYRWSGWISRIEKAGLTRSMSKKGCSPDNFATREETVHFQRSVCSVSAVKLFF